MVGWIILGIIVALVVLILSIPIGVDASYEGGELRVSAKAAGVLLQLYPKPPDEEEKPKKEKEPKPKKEKKPREEKSKDEEKKGLPLGLNFDELLEIAKIALRGVGRFPSKLRVDRFLLHFTAAGNDPYNTAMTYAYVNEALSILAPLCRRSMKIKTVDVWTNIDFVGDTLRLDAALALSIRIGQIFGIVNSIAFGALKVILRSKRRQKKEKAAAPADQIENDINNIQDEERMAANG